MILLPANPYMGNKTAATIMKANTPKITIKTGSIMVVATAGGYPATPGSINIELGKTCAGNSSTRAVSAWYLIETANGPANQCQDS